MLETLALQPGNRGTPEGGVPVCEPPVHSWDVPALGAQPILEARGAAFLIPTLCLVIGARYHTLWASGGSGPGPAFLPRSAALDSIVCSTNSVPEVEVDPLAAEGQSETRGRRLEDRCPL